MATVDGVVTAAGPTGVVVGNGGEVDKIAGGSGNDRLEGRASQNIYYGGAGSDTFIISSQFLDASRGSTTALTVSQNSYSNAVDIIGDFQGAGGWFATNNDFVAFTNFASGSSITALGSSSSATANAPDAKLYYYDLFDAGTGLHYSVAINSVNGVALGAGDFNFF